MSYWVIAHGSPEVRLYWAGYVSARKDHLFKPDPTQAIRFCRQEDAVNAGVGLTQGIKIIEVLEE